MAAGHNVPAYAREPFGRLINAATLIVNQVHIRSQRRGIEYGFSLVIFISVNHKNLRPSASKESIFSLICVAPLQKISRGNNINLVIQWQSKE
jgi:hypothetical protein